MDFWKSMAGMVGVELTSADLGTVFSAINNRNIPMYNVQHISDLTTRFVISRSDFAALSALCERRGETLRIVSRRGLYWPVKNLVKRPVLLLGLAVLVSLLLYLPTRVFFVQVEGNSLIPARQIIAAAEESGIRFGASRREVRSEKMKNALLSAVPELQWAGVNTSGCVAVISVRERTDTKPEEEENQISSIVAVRDGIIFSCTVTRGNLLVNVGQAVKEGQILVSAYTDCGICIQATQAEGEIFARTNRELTAITPCQWVERMDKTDTKQKISLLIGKKRINLWKDSGISDTTCGRMYEEYYITLPGGFQLPVALCVEEYSFYETAESEIPQPAAEGALSDFADTYLAEQMVAGNILDKAQSIALEAGFYRLEGQYVCTEMIGRVQQEQIGEEDGKSD